MARLLVCEDENDLAALLRFHLERAGHRVTLARDARSAVESARQVTPDLVVLDWNLPDRPGTEVLRTLRAEPPTRDVPVLFLTARDAEIDRVIGFELGAEDYVVKPVSLRELALRIAALLRRRGHASRPGRFCARGLVIEGDPDRPIELDGRPAPLVWQTEAILRVLATAPETPIGRDRLLRALHGAETDVGERSVDQWVLRLREQLGPAAACIETVRGVGYRLTAADG